ncbi:hypothetical protein POM88_038641 [Heracleum sosnowskyi]|uniref:Uncharacterized protein n=1 Tax=Heracleum sosnowskyi TaxID=360622 RepID=A0AAD8H8X3_9APIA|nr:hypothetical protein POM88_038641 [Heracleum sosnowskyi]
MADEKKRSKKRKMNTVNELGQTKKCRCVEKESSKEEEESLESPWSNLQLLLSLQKASSLNQSTQTKEIDDAIELAFNYVVKYRVSESENDKDIVGIPRLVVFVNNWIQSLLITSAKRIIADDFFWDHRCWEIFRFCLDESVKHKVSLSFKKDLLQVVQCMARYVLSCLLITSSDIQVKEFDYDIVLYCLSCIFTSHGGIPNKDMNLWVSTVESVLNLVRKIIQDKLDDYKIGVFVLHLSCVVIEPYSSYLKVHPTGKKGFDKILENLLELLLYMLDVLHPYSSDYGWKGNLWKLIKEVLSQGLFHPVHIDGFMSVQSLNKYKMSSDYQKIWNSKMVVESYHIHFFDKVDKIMTGTNALALGNNIGELFRSYVDCIKKQKEFSVVGGRGSGQLQDRPNGQIAAVSSRKGSGGIVL